MALLAEETKVVTIDGQARPLDDLPEQAFYLVGGMDMVKEKAKELQG